MFEARLSWLQEQGNAELIRRGHRGVEKESLRVTERGRLSPAPHPEGLGAALTHPFLTTDYSEALLEIVTPVHAANWETLQFLCDIHAFVHRRLSGELLWPASMPCVLDPDHEIPIAQYGGSNLGLMKTVYRRGLGFRYGRAMQAIAGVHFNYSLPQRFWPAYRDREGGHQAPAAFKAERYMDLVRNYRRHAWLVIYLFGASPAVCKSFRPEGTPLLAELDGSTWHAPYATSLRMSDIGYRNKTQARLNISANSLGEYVSGLASAVATPDPRYQEIGVMVDGEYRQLNASILQIENEYYSAIRPKPSKRSALRPTAALARDGVEYVEIRTLDLQVADPVGVNQNQLRFLEALLVYCLLSESPPISADEQEEINVRELEVARQGRRPGLALAARGGRTNVREAGLRLLEDIGEIAALLDAGGEGYAAAVETQRQALLDPDATPSARLLDELSRTRTSFFEYVLDLARRHREYFLALPVEAETEAAFDAAAHASLAQAARLEGEDSVPFDEYLRRYFEEA